MHSVAALAARGALATPEFRLSAGRELAVSRAVNMPGTSEQLLASRARHLVQIQLFQFTRAQRLRLEAAQQSPIDHQADGGRHFARAEQVVGGHQKRRPGVALFQ